MERVEDAAARTVTRAVRSVYQRRTFAYLKSILRRAEQSTARELLQRVCPREASFLDPCLPVALRFRFAGEVFPPDIVFKVFTRGPGTTVYMTGSTQISQSDAWAESLQAMPRRVAVSLVLEEARVRESVRVVEDDRRAAHVLSAHLDRVPVRLGGRGNPWRPLWQTPVSSDTRLTLEAALFGTPLGGTPGGSLRLPSLPPNERDASVKKEQAALRAKLRRSRYRQKRAQQMMLLYSQHLAETGATHGEQAWGAFQNEQPLEAAVDSDSDSDGEGEGDLDLHWDEEGSVLYEWAMALEDGADGGAGGVAFPEYEENWLGLGASLPLVE